MNPSLGEWEWRETAVCPHEQVCPDPLVSFDIGKYPSYVSIVSSSFSCFGSLLIILTYCLLKEMRTGAQKIITLLAIADFFTAFGYIMGGINFIVSFKNSDRIEESYNCPVFTSICEIQSFITTWSTMSSYCWTCFLAFYFFLVLVFQKSLLANRLLPVFNVIAWIGPLLIVFPLLVFNKLGYAPYVASNWCYIKDLDYTSQDIASQEDTIMYIIIGGKLWEVLCYVIIVVLYFWIKISVSKSRHIFNRDDSVSLPNVVTVEKRLLAIPLFYIFLRMWGTIQFIYSLIVSNTNKYGCIPHTVQIGYQVFGYLQAIGDGGQGWCNAILYIAFSAVMRRKLCGEPCEKCLHIAERKILKALESESDDTTYHRDRAVVSNIVRVSDDEKFTESAMNRPVDASGYKIQQLDSSTTIATPSVFDGSNSINPLSPANSNKS